MTLLAPLPTSDPTAPEGVAICPLGQLQVGRGVTALVGGRAVALFRLDPALLEAGDHGIRAIDNIDPYAGASVLARGLVGCTGEGTQRVHYVASPLRKQRFDLLTGAELDGPGELDVWPVEVRDGVVMVLPQTSCTGNEPETAS